MDNIEVAYAREKGLHVINTPAASSEKRGRIGFHTFIYRMQIFTRF